MVRFLRWRNAACVLDLWRLWFGWWRTGLRCRERLFRVAVQYLFVLVWHFYRTLLTLWQRYYHYSRRTLSEGAYKLEDLNLLLLHFEALLRNRLFLLPLLFPPLWCRRGPTTTQTWIFIKLQRKFWVIQHLISTRHSLRLAKLPESVGFMGSFSLLNILLAYLALPFWEAVGAYSHGLFALYNGLLQCQRIGFARRRERRSGEIKGIKGGRQSSSRCCCGPKVS